MLIEDEGMVIPGLLVGLNVIDCNMCIKEEDLDQPVSHSVCLSHEIFLSHYFRNYITKIQEIWFQGL